MHYICSENMDNVSEISDNEDNSCNVRAKHG